MTLREEIIQRLKTVITANNKAKQLYSDFQKEGQRHNAIWYYKNGQPRKQLHKEHRQQIRDENKQILEMCDQSLEAKSQWIQLRDEFYEFINDNASEILEIKTLGEIKTPEEVEEIENECEEIDKDYGSIKHRSKATAMFDKYMKEKYS